MVRFAKSMTVNYYYMESRKHEIQLYYLIRGIISNLVMFVPQQLKKAGTFHCAF